MSGAYIVGSYQKSYSLPPHIYPPHKLSPLHEKLPAKANARNNVDGSKSWVSPLKKLRQVFRKDRATMGYKGKKLEEAVFRRDHKWVKKWIDAGANTYKKDDNGCSLIDWAALSGDSKTVDVLLSKSSFGLSSDTLSKAAGKGHTDVVKVLLSHPNSCNKIDVNEADYLGQTALSMAARKGRVDVVNALLSHTKINMDEDARRYLDRLVDTNDVYSIQEIVLNGCSKKVYDHLYTKAIEAGKEHLIERLSHLFTGYANTQALGGHNKAYSGSGNVPEGILDTVKEYLNSNLPKTQALQPR